MMYNIRTLNQISHIGLTKLPKSEFNISDTEENMKMSGSKYTTRS